jgi:hypothetical protein
VPTFLRLAWPLWLSLAIVAGCDGDTSSRRGAHPPPSRPDAMDADGLAWRGLMACADCEGIDTLLELGRAGGARYRLVEVFVTADGEVRFEEQGEWRREGRVLFLLADGGGERVFGLEPDGRLSLLDARGLGPAGEGRVLEPVTPGPPP